MKYSQYHKFFFITKRSGFVGYRHILKYHNEEVLSFLTSFTQTGELKELIVQYLNKNGSSLITDIQYLKRSDRLLMYFKTPTDTFTNTLYLDMPINPKFYSYFKYEV